MSHPLMEQIEELPMEEKLDLAHSIWELISANPEAVPVSAEDLAEVRLSIEEHRSAPESVETWESVRRQITST